MNAPQPISACERILSIDVLRGVALCGILVMNIPWFARASSAFFDPTKAGGFEGADYWTWLLSHLFFDMKMMTIFSMLFGAGMLIFTQRAEAKGRSAGVLYYRRLGWLLVFGLMHAYLLWDGDILYSYALCGLILYPMRRLRPRTLMIIGAALLVVGNAITLSSGVFFDVARTNAQQAEDIIARGETPSGFQQDMLDAWPGIKNDFVPDEETLATEAAAYRGPYGQLFLYRAKQSFFMQTSLFLMMLFWRAAGVMVLGMGLMKLDVLTGRRSAGSYARMMLAGYLIGLPMVGVGAWLSIKTDFNFVASFEYIWTFNYVGSIFVALGHIGLIMLIMLICTFGVLKWLTAGLAAIGRMALTNYLMHTLICSIIFFGWGFGMWGRWSRFDTMAVVLAVWIFQFIASQLWLKAFRFGPMEWLWRTLTYWRVQPMRRSSTLPAFTGTA